MPLVFLVADATQASVTAIASVKTAFQYGPFYYAVLLLCTVASASGLAYRSVAKRAGVQPEVVEAHRKAFLASFYLGLTLVGASVVWWMTARPRVYTYTAVVRNLREYESIIAEDGHIYSRPEIINIIDEDGAQMRVEHLLIVQPSPFEPGQTFRLQFAKNHKSSGVFELEYVADQDEPAFMWSYDKQTQKNKLERATSVGPRTGGLLRFVVSEAHAEEPRAMKTTKLADRSSNAMSPLAERAMSASPAPVLTPLRLRRECLSFAPLIRPDSNVGARIVAADEIAALPDDVARGCLADGPEGLQFIATLRGLTRHSDPELADKADSLSKKLNWERMLTAALRSQDARQRSAAENALNQLPASDTAHIAAVTGLNPSQRNVARPLPTGTSSGDRYYVKASWRAEAADVVECLARIFNQELETSRSLADERKLMAGRTSRVVYSGAPEWAEHMSSEISHCGATPAYVSF